MKLYYITFRSVTFAQRGEQLLQKEGIPVVLMRTPRWMEAQGCGYCLRLKTKDIAGPVRILREFGVNLRKVYLQKGNGQWEEWLE